MQLNIFELTKPKYKITKPIRLIELFAGIGSQAKALQNIGANFEHYKVVEFDKYAVASYNAIHGTDFETLDITKIGAEDLNIIDTDKFEYILTYSFPCQDLSLAGKGRGMKKGNNTRSGLLWEVERLLEECCGYKEKRIPPKNTTIHSMSEFVDDYNYNIDKTKLPQILLMENVPQVISKANYNDFREWEKKLESLGYSNYFENLNAKDYGIPQNRNRTFMVSILGDYYYEFPKKQKLKLRLRDLLEDEVDEKYYLSGQMIDYIVAGNEKWTGNNNKSIVNKSVASTINTGEGSRRCDASNYILTDIDKDDIDLKNVGSSGISQKGMIQTIKTQSDDIGVVVKGNYSPSGHSASRIVDKDGIAPTVMDNHGTITATQLKDLRIRKLTPKECWRLMGFTDEDFEKASKVNSNAQLYKQSGNSIVVQVLEDIFKELL